MKYEHVWELCPICRHEVKLKAEFRVQTCPKCKKPILPCALCEPDKTDCSKCKLEGLEDEDKLQEIYKHQD